MKRLWLIGAATFVVAACSGGGDSTAPTSASPVTTAAASANGSTTNTDGKTSTPTTSTTSSTATTVTGTVSALAGTCPSLSFSLGGKTVKTDASTSFGDGGCAAVKNGVTAGAQGTAQADGSILAKAVRVLPPPPATVSGKVSAVSGTCPALTFTLGGKTVKTNASTTFSGGACADVKNDASAGAMGALQADGSILATQVKVLPPPPPPPVTVSGKVSAASGTCPTLTFTLGGKTVKTAASTEYAGGACADVKNDASAMAVGTVQADGSLLAKGVRLLPPPPVAVSGKLSAVSGTCPALTFTLGGKTVKTNASTTFSGGACADVKNDASAGAIGAAQADGSILATTVKLLPPPPPPPAIVGVVSAVSGTCPAITITIGTKTAITSAATTYERKSCADVKTGATVGIYGSVASGATAVSATRIIVK